MRLLCRLRFQYADYYSDRDYRANNALDSRSRIEWNRYRGFLGWDFVSARLYCLSTDVCLAFSCLRQEAYSTVVRRTLYRWGHCFCSRSEFCRATCRSKHPRYWRRRYHQSHGDIDYGSDSITRERYLVRVSEPDMGNWLRHRPSHWWSFCSVSNMALDILDKSPVLWDRIRCPPLLLAPEQKTWINMVTA